MQILCRLSDSEGPSNWLHRSRTLGLAIKAILDAQVANNRLYLSLHSRVPPLYHSGVRYENEPGWTFQGQPVEEFALIPIVIARGWGDCLAEGTLIATPNGDVPIESLTAGDYVMTRDGARRVERQEQTYVEAPLWQLTTTDERTLLGSGNHPVSTKEHGFQHLSRLVPGDTLELRQGFFSRVAEVKEAGRGALYNLTVEDAHHYYASGLLTHNCDDLAPWRCAELQMHGEHAKIRVQWKRPTLSNGKKGRKYFHIVVKRSNGFIEDPSEKLGMSERVIA